MGGPRLKVLVLGFVSALALALAGSAVALDISHCKCEHDRWAEAASGIVCPAGPAGWVLGGSGWATAGAGIDGRYVRTPLSVLDAGARAGGDQAQVECNYMSRTSEGSRLVVLVRYAVPESLNPFADFFVGCKTNRMGIGAPTGPKPWDARDRIFRVVSDVSWSYATFIDGLSQLRGGSDVRGFEQVARTMLKSAEPVAHNCQLSKEAVPIGSYWLFGFDASVKHKGLTTTGAGTGSFSSTPSSSGVTSVIGGLRAEKMSLTISRGTKRIGVITFRVLSPVWFKYSSYGAELKIAVRVSASSYKPCAAGAKGTLTLSTNTNAAALQICGRAMLRGDGTTNPYLDKP